MVVNCRLWFELHVITVSYFLTSELVSRAMEDSLKRSFFQKDAYTRQKWFESRGSMATNAYGYVCVS